MPPISAPKFPVLTKELLGDRLDAFKAHVDQATAADGTVDVEKLKQSIAATGDVGLQQSLRAVLDAFQREQRVDYGPVTGGCGGGVRVVRSEPKTLEQGEVANVMSALIRAKTEAGKLDGDGGGAIDEKETEAARNIPGLEGAFVRGALRASTTEYQAEKAKWDAAIRDAATRMDLRERTSARIDEMADGHAETKEGADALRWAYRSVLVSKPASDVVTEAQRAGAAQEKLASDVKSAETSLLRFVPFWDVTAQKGHLSDKEIKALLGTNDLAKFAADKQAEVAGKAGGDWDGWVKGRGIELASQVPPQARVRSNC